MKMGKISGKVVQKAGSKWTLLQPGTAPPFSLFLVNQEINKTIRV
jgi:hypothetical protein